MSRSDGALKARLRTVEGASAHGTHGALVAAVLAAVLAGSATASAQSPSGLAAADGSRPVVLVHGFNASAATWDDYLGADGYLARAGLEGFALGAEEFGFELAMGDVGRPRAATNTIAQNARILADAIAAVRQLTGAASVDIVAHSMGGLVARYYVAKLMAEPYVAQLILLGTPHGGSACALLPAALGFYLPAALELRPSYLDGIFNPQVVDLQGVSVTTLAGTPIKEALRAPCTGVPSDLVVDLDSAAAAGGELYRLPLLHTELNSSVQAFEEFVAPLLLRPNEALAGAVSAPTPLLNAAQATHVYSGVVKPGSPIEVEIDLDAVTLASFAMFDPSTSLDVQVTGASGALVTLTPEANGLLRVDDPASLVNLGYGFTSPRPGPWRVAVLPGPDTPSSGAEFALLAKVVGGATLKARAEPLLPAIGELVTITATVDDVDTDREELVAVVRRPDGRLLRLAMRLDPSSERLSGADATVSWVGSWRPTLAGLHGIDVLLTAVTVDGLEVERTVELTAEVQGGRWGPTVLVSAVVVFLVFVTLAAIFLRRTRTERPSR